MITANLATYSGRRNILPKAVDSLKAQNTPFDKIRIYANDYCPDVDGVEVVMGEDITDRGKFAFVEPGEIYFSCDDDIIYPPFYSEYMLSRLQDYPECIISLHGRRLKGKGLHYYNDHRQYHFMQELSEDKIIDVPGTGVMAFNSDHYQPELLKKDKMVDVLVGLDAARKGIDVVCVAHSCFWMKALSGEGIYHELRDECSRQSELCDVIWDEKY